MGLRFMKAFDDICENKDNSEFYDIKKITNLDNCYRFRLGQYKAMYRIDNNKIIIYVFAIGSRGDIYKHTNM